MTNLIDSLSSRDKAFILQDLMNKQPIGNDIGNRIELEVKHIHGGGIFTGELFIPKGIMLVGKIHKYENLNVLTKGEVSVLINDEMKRIKAPYVVVAPSGSKRIIYAHEDAIWMTFHPTTMEYASEVEHYFIAQTEKEYLAFLDEQPKQLELLLCG